MRPSTLFLAVAMLAAVGSEAAAQSRIRVTPFIGIYTAFANEVVYNGVGTRQAFSAAFGAKVLIWTSPRVGLEVSGAYARSSVVPETGPPETPGNVAIGSLRLLYQLTMGTSACAATVGGCQPALYVAGGLGVINRGGQAWQGVSGVTKLAGSAGAGLRIPITPSVQARIDAEFLLYSASFTYQTVGKTSAQFQQDLVLSSGVWIPL